MLIPNLILTDWRRKRYHFSLKSDNLQIMSVKYGYQSKICKKGKTLYGKAAAPTILDTAAGIRTVQDVFDKRRKNWYQIMKSVDIR